MRTKFLIVFFMTILVLTYACQGKKESETKPVKGKAAAGFVVNFRPNDSPDLIPDNTLILQLAGAEIVGGHPKSINTGKEGEFCLDVLAKAIVSVSGVHFAVSFNPGYAAYFDYKPGSLFEQKAKPNYKIGHEGGQKGKLEVDISLEAGSPGVNGSGNLVTLCFKALSDGRDDFLFENGELRDAQRQKIAGVNWVGGLLWILKPR